MCYGANYTQPRHVENALIVGTLLRNSPHNIHDLFQRCGHASMRVLGLVNPKETPVQVDSSHLVVYTDASTRLPQIYCLPGSSLMAQVIMYDRPNPTRMQYLSLIPMSLALGDKSDFGKWDEAFEGAGKEEERERKRKEKLVEKLKLHTVLLHRPTQKELSLPKDIDQINCSFELNSLLQKNAGLIGRRTKRALSVSEFVVESANNLWDYLWALLVCIWKDWVYPVVAEIFILLLMAQRIVGEVLLRILDWRPGSNDSPALKDISATAQQLDIRLQQFCYWPIQYLTLRKRKANWASITTSHPEYIRYYNSLWLVANDVIIGVAIGSYLIENSRLLARQMDLIFTAWSIEGLRRMISWLMEWPGGLKLNTELAEFLGDLFLWVIDHWAGECSTTLSYAYN